MLHWSDKAKKQSSTTYEYAGEAPPQGQPCASHGESGTINNTMEEQTINVPVEKEDAASGEGGRW